MTGPSMNPPDFDSFEWDESEFEEILGPKVPEAPTVEPTESEEASAPEVRQQPVQTQDRRRVYRRETDPVFAYILLMAFSVGLMPLAANNPIERYTVLWTGMALLAVFSILLNKEPVFSDINANDLIRGAGFGLMLGAPLLLVGAGILAQTSSKIFVNLPDGAVFQSIVFVMSTTETLFFRGVMQRGQSWLVTALMAAGWSFLLFFPAVSGYLYPALVIGTFIVMLSVLYSYVRQRNGLAAAWLCQIVVSVMWLFLPRLLA